MSQEGAPRLPLKGEQPHRDQENTKRLQDALKEVRTVCWGLAGFGGALVVGNMFRAKVAPLWLATLAVIGLQLAVAFAGAFAARKVNVNPAEELDSLERSYLRRRRLRNLAALLVLVAFGMTIAHFWMGGASTPKPP